jgi:hypothetical protein
MTIAEFKAWLDGFKEAIGDAPTPEQWQRITAKMATVYELQPVLYSTLYQERQPDHSFRLSPVWCGPATSTTIASGECGSASTQAVVNGRPVGPSD